MKIGPGPETQVGGASLWELRELREVVIPEGTERIGNYWFYCCKLESVKLPPGLKEIGTEAFYGCGKLAHIDLPDGLEVIGLRAFRRSGLEEIVTPGSLREISCGAFCQCENLKSTVLNEGLEVLGAANSCGDNMNNYGVFEESGLERVKFPSTLKTLTSKAFMNCKHLKKVDFSEGLERIEMTCFTGTGLEDVEFPASLRIIS